MLGDVWVWLVSTLIAPDSDVGVPTWLCCIEVALPLLGTETLPEEVSTVVTADPTAAVPEGSWGGAGCDSCESVLGEREEEPLLERLCCNCRETGT